MINLADISLISSILDPSLAWIADAGVAVPEKLAAARIVAATDPQDTEIAFVPLFTTEVERISRLRKQLGPHVYFVAVIEGHRAFTSHRLAQLFDAGIDDLLDPSDAAEVALCVARSRAALRRRRLLVGENDELKRAHGTLLAAMNNLPSPIFFKDRDGIYRAVNKAFEIFFGKDRKDILGASAFDITAFPAATTFFEADRKLLAEGGVQIYETAVVRADGAPRYVTFYKSVVQQDDGAIAGIAGAMIDVTDRKETEVRLREAADRDFLTGLPNRRHFLAHAEAQMSVNRSNDRLSFIAIGDIDHFKGVNDRYGHACGDAVLRHVADILLARLGQGHLVARAGGEEFFMMLDCLSFLDATHLLEAVRSAIAKSPFDWEDERLWITASFGLTDVRRDERSLSSALARADEALYAAKHRGRNKVVGMETDFVADRGGI